MFIASALLVLTFSLFISCEEAFVDTLSKCSIKNEECIKELFQSAIKTIGPFGVKELGISALDPMNITNFSVNITKDFSITVTEGSGKGMTNCVLNSFNIDWEKERALLNSTCNMISIKGQFVVSGENPDIQGIIGSNNLNGHGRAKIKLDNINFNIEYPMYATKKDGDIYLMVSNKNIKYTYDIGNMHFITEKIIIANTDLSQIISAYLNDKWREIMEQFGPVIMAKALELYVGLIANIFDKIPANKYILEDLHSYLKN